MNEAEFEAAELGYELSQRHFERSKPREEIVAEFEKLQAEANQIDTYNLRCFNCKKKVTGPNWREAVGEGHIYSREGRREFALSKLCEYCFDEITDCDDPDSEDEADYPPDPGPPDFIIGEDNPHILISPMLTSMGKTTEMKIDRLKRKMRGEL